jgi:RHS repeat-associated protein
MLWRWLLLVLPLLGTLAGANPVNLQLNSSCLAHGCVNVFTGALQQSHVDLQLRCAQPFALTRLHCSDETDSKGKASGIWRIASESISVYEESCQPSAGGPWKHWRDPTIVLDSDDLGEFRIQTKDLKGSHCLDCRQLTNGWGGVLSGATDLSNARLQQESDNTFVLRLGSGETRFYEAAGEPQVLRRYHAGDYSYCDQKRYYYLHRVRLANGNWIRYRPALDHAEGPKLRRIEIFNSTQEKLLGWIDFARRQEGESGVTRATGSDGQWVDYYYRVGVLWAVVKSNGERHEYNHTHDDLASCNRQINRIHGLAQWAVDVDYYKAKSDCLGNGFHPKYSFSKPEAHYFNPLVAVKEIRQSMQPDRQGVVVARLFYYPAWHRAYWYSRDGWQNEFLDDVREFRTEAFDALGCRTTYEYFKTQDWNNAKAVFFSRRACRLSAIVHHLGEGASYDYPRVAHCREMFEWEQQQGIGRLRAKTIADAGSNHIARRVFYYEDKGNVRMEALVGDICGEGRNDVIEIYRDYERNLTTREQSPHGEIRNWYKPDTNLLVAQISSSGQQQQRRFFEYDDAGTLVCEITDDGMGSQKDDLNGVTCRRIRRIETVQSGTAIGLPRVIKELYWDPEEGREVLLKRVVNNYNDRNLIVRRDTYSGDGTIRYCVHASFDDRDRLISETNALGETTRYEEDQFGHRLREVRSGHEIRYSYDLACRLVAKESISPNGDRLTWQYEYNDRGDRIAERDCGGCETRYDYDALGRRTRITYPDGTTTSYEYDILGNVTAQTDQNGRTIRRKYTIQGNVSEITYPDGARELFRYDLRGFLVRHTAKNGLVTHYERDWKGRLLKEEKCSPTGELLTRSLSGYWGDFLVNTTSPQGIYSLYSYDNAGRLVGESSPRGNIDIEYDSLGRKVKEILHDREAATIHAWDYDYLDRVIEERIEDSNGQVFTRTQYEYDHEGNQIVVATFTAKGERAASRTEYDSQGRPVRRIDPAGNETLYHYEFVTPIDPTQAVIARHQKRRRKSGRIPQLVLRTTEIDPLGRSTRTTFDACSRPALIEQRNAGGTLLQSALCRYDNAGNKTCEEHTVLSGGKPLRTYALEWQYDSCNRVIRLQEGVGSSMQRTTYFEYDSVGRLACTTKPSGKKICREYDVLGRLSRISSEALDYSYAYDRDDRLLEVKDSAKTAACRCYDPLGRLIDETLLNGAHLSYNHDEQGRLKDLRLPDGSRTHYSYNAVSIAKIERYLANRKLLYDFEYRAIDPAGHVLAARLPGNCGEIAYAWDLNGRPTDIVSNAYRSHVPAEGYDRVGGLVALHTLDPQGELHHHYAYDDLDQLICEEGAASHTYSYDSLRNRTSCDGQQVVVDELNQLCSDAHCTYSHDADGRLVRKSCGNKTIFYVYDGFDRLTSLQTETLQVEFTYDPLNRRMSKALYIKGAGSPQLRSRLRYVYAGQDEIGALDSGDKLVEYRALGRGRGAEIGAAAAIELDGEVYVPIHNQGGSVVFLLNLAGDVVESYRYTAFGTCQVFDAAGQLQQHSPLGNPWQFCSKRIDEESGLVYFGRRYYSPSTGRWITPDPLGHGPGPNLYAYCQNAPHSRLDLYGLVAKLAKKSSSEERTEYSSIWEKTKETFSSMLDSLCSAVSALGSALCAISHAVGTAVEEVATHMPDPVRRIGIVLGESLKGNRPERCMFDKHVELHRSELSTTAKVWHTNGILNTARDAQVARLKAEQAANAPIDLLYIPTRGVSMDLWLSLLNYWGVHTRDVREAAWYLAQRLDLLQSGKPFGMSAHSRGTMVVELALHELQPHYRERVATTYVGGRWARADEGAGSVVIRCSRDLVSWLCKFLDGWRWQQAEYRVLEVPASRNSLFPHSLLGGDYEKPWLDTVKRMSEWIEQQYQINEESTE